MYVTVIGPKETGLLQPRYPPTSLPPSLHSSLTLPQSQTSAGTSGTVRASSQSGSNPLRSAASLPPCQDPVHSQKDPPCSLTMWKEWPHFPTTRAQTPRQKKKKKKKKAPGRTGDGEGGGPYVADNRHLETCNSDTSRRTAHDRCRRRRPRERPSAMTRLRSST